MKLTIGDVLSLEIMKDAVIRAGESFLKDRFVQWISVIEMPVENFVRQNELVLTTGIGCGENPEVFLSFVKDIINSEATALVVALGRHVFQLPKEVVELAEKEKFILIEIPWEVRFANIIEEVMGVLNNRQHKIQERSDKVQQELLKLILQEKDLISILRYIEKEIGYPLVLTDKAGIIQVHPNHEIMKNWNRYVMLGIVPKKQETAVLSHDPVLQKLLIIEVDEYSILQLPILQVSGAIQGYLFLLFPAWITINDYLTNYMVNVLEHVTTTIALWLSRKNAIEATKMRLRSDFVFELAQGNIHKKEQARSRARLLGYNLKLPYVCIVGYPENLRSLFEKRKRVTDSYEDWFNGMIRYIEEEIFYSAQSLSREVMITDQDEHLLLFIETTQGATDENSAAFLDLVERRLRSLLPDVIISWGIGGYHENLEGFKKSYENARLALKLGRRKNGIGKRTLYENTRIDRILLTLANNDEIQDVILRTIHPLIQYDQQRGMDLIGTLDTYNRCNGNVSQTARTLNLHRQSLLYRLRKIESLTSLTLVDPDDLFLLELCIKIWKLGLFVNEQG